MKIFEPRSDPLDATFEPPHQHPIGIEYVLVNGELAVDKGQQTPALAGRVIVVQVSGLNDELGLYLIDAQIFRY